MNIISTARVALLLASRSSLVGILPDSMAALVECQLELLRAVERQPSLPKQRLDEEVIRIHDADVDLRSERPRSRRMREDRAAPSEAPLRV